MKTTTGLSSGSILLRRLRRHAEIAALRQPAAELPAPGQIHPSWEAPGYPDMPGMQAETSPLDAAQEPQVQPHASRRFDTPVSPVPGNPPAYQPVQRQGAPGGPQAPLPPSPGEAPAPPAGPDAENDWQRLHAILSAHREKQASETLASTGQDTAAAAGTQEAQSTTADGEPGSSSSMSHGAANRFQPPAASRLEPATGQAPPTPSLAAEPGQSQAPPQRARHIEERAPAVQAQPASRAAPAQGLPQLPVEEIPQTHPLSPADLSAQPAAQSHLAPGSTAPAPETAPGSSQPGQEPPMSPVGDSSPGQGMRKVEQSQPAVRLPQELPPGPLDVASQYTMPPMGPELAGQVAEAGERDLAAQPEPLEAAWPVTRRDIGPAGSGHAIQESREGSPAPPATEVTAQPPLPDTAPRSTGHADEVLPPRGPRPAAALPLASGQSPSPHSLPADETGQPGSPHAAATAAAAQDTVQTSIGPLPADLWALLGEKPPTPSVQRAPVQPAISARPAIAPVEATQTRRPPGLPRAVVQASAESAPPVAQDDWNEPPQTATSGHVSLPDTKTSSVHSETSQTVQASQAGETGTTQGAETAAAQEPETSTTSSSNAAETGQLQNADLSDLVHRVYAEIRRRLAVEWERSRR